MLGMARHRDEAWAILCELLELERVGRFPNRHELRVRVVDLIERGLLVESDAEVGVGDESDER
jgi:hypothetical protein